MAELALQKPALCEDCKQAKPKSKITREKNGATYTLWLCRACAEERQAYLDCFVLLFFFFFFFCFVAIG